MGACPGDAPQYSGPCFATNTRVTGASTGTTIVIDKPLLCSIPAGTYIAAAAGYPNLLISHSTFHDIGQGLTTAGTAVFLTSAAMTIPAAGTTPTLYTMTLQCGAYTPPPSPSTLDPNCKNAYAVIPGQVAVSWYNATTMTNPAIGDTVLFGAENTLSMPTVNHTIGTVTVTLQATGSASQSLPANAQITFNVGKVSGLGFGLGIQNTPWFATVDGRVEDTSFYRTYSGPLGVDGSSNLQIIHTTVKEEHTEYQSTVIAPSGCMGFSSSIGLQLIDDVCSGATGAGVQLNRPTNAEVLGGMYAHNSDSGLFACGAQGLTVGGGVQFVDNGEWVDYPLIQSSPTNVGLHITPSCSTAQPGYQSNVQVTDAAFIDDRPNPTGGCPITDGTGYLDTQYGSTQTYGIGTSGGQLSPPNTILLGAGITFSGKTCGAIDPNVALATNVVTPPVFNVQVFTYGSSPGTWTAPSGCATASTPAAPGVAAACMVHVIAIGGGGGSGAGAMAASGSTSGGGAGGAGACPGWPNGVAFLSSTLPASVAVTVGAKGYAGVAPGSAGTAGLASLFGSFVTANGGGGGAGGTTTGAGGGGAAGPGGAGGTGTGAMAGAGVASLGTVAGGSGSVAAGAANVGLPNPLSANASGSGANTTAAVAGVAAACDASGGAGGGLSPASAGGAGGVATSASGGSGGTAVTSGTGNTGGSATVSAGLTPTTGGGGGGGASSGGAGGAGGACPTAGYGSTGGGGGAGTTGVGRGGASCAGYVAVVTTPG